MKLVGWLVGWLAGLCWFGFGWVRFGVGVASLAGDGVVLGLGLGFEAEEHCILRRNRTSYLLLNY
jgi:hypothetical protein